MPDTPMSPPSESPSPHDPRRRAEDWLETIYRGLVELAVPDPVAEDSGGWQFGCRSKAQSGYPRTPMLAATVVVPKNGCLPFHPAADDPRADIADFRQHGAARTPEAQARKLNARGCAVAVCSAINGTPSSPLPWSPVHEAPGWWQVLLRRYFPGARVLKRPGPDWDAVIAAAREAGPGTRGIVWVRRETGGVESTGHLLAVHNNNGKVVLLDGMTNGLARMEIEGVRGLVLAWCPAGGEGGPDDDASRPWQQPADGFDAAVRKAEAWLEHTYDEPVVLVAPGLDDERERGWLFACNTRSFLEKHDPTRGMLDAAVVVPRSAAEPFGLPNSDPWAWFDAWDRGRNPGLPGDAGSAVPSADGVLPPPPLPGPAAWLPATLEELGRPLAMSEHGAWPGVLDALSAMPVGARTLIWVRRTDAKGRETVGSVLTALHTDRGNAIIDGSEHPVTDLSGLDARSFYLVRYR